MIRLGLRLSLAGGKESVVRLAVVAFAVGLGVAMLLATVAAINGVGSQNARGAWLATAPAATVGTPPASGARASDGAGTRAGSLWWLVTPQQFGDQTIVRVDVAAAGPHAPVPPGIPHLPGPGQFYASPALSALLRTTPPAELGDRFGGTEVGTIGPRALPSPSDLVIVVGHRATALARIPGAGLITGYATSAPNGGPLSITSIGLQVLLAVMALVLVFPVLVFIATATRLSAARREQRFAAMRLVGATTRQVATVAAVEAGLAAVAGTVLGFGLYLVAHPALVHATFAGQPFEPGDLSLSWVDIAVVALGVPVAAVVAGRLALRRVTVSPLGVARRATPRAPRAYRLVPLVAGVGELAYFVAAGHPQSSGGQIEAYFFGFLLIMFGLVVAGPWFTLAGGRAMARWSRRAAVLLAGRRLSDDPRGAFRAISGLILALFVTSAAVGMIATVLSDHGSTATGSPASDTVIAQLDVATTTGSLPSAPSAPSGAVGVASAPSSVMGKLHAVEGVRGVTLVHTPPHGMTIDGEVPDINGIGGTVVPGVVSCAQLERTPALGRCHPGAVYAAVGTDLGFMPVTKSVGVAAGTTWPTAHLPHGAGGLRVRMIAVATDGSSPTIARVQTVLDDAFPFTTSTVALFGQLNERLSQVLTELQTASEVVIVASLLIAGCSLAVSMVAGLSERRRPFSLLRLAGAPLGVLRRVVGFEAAVPLVVIALGAAAVGLLAAQLFLRSQLGLSLRVPWGGYSGIVLGGLAASLLIVASTLPLLDRTTRPEAVRAE